MTRISIVSMLFLSMTALGADKELTASDYFSVADNYYEKKRYKKSIENYTLGLELASNNPDIYKKRGDSYLALEKMQEALNDYQSAVVQNDTLHDVHFKIADIAFNHFADIHLAKKALVKSIELHQRNYKYYRLQAIIAEVEDSYNDALLGYHSAIELNPLSSDLFYRRALLYIQGNRNFKAIKDLTRALRYDRTNPTYLSARGKAYQGKFDRERALNDINHSLKLRPNHAETLLTRADIYRSMKRYNNALKDIALIQKIDTKYANNSQLFNIKGAIYLGLSDYKMAVKQYTKAITLEEKDYTYYFNRAIVYEELRKNKLALADYSKAIKIKPDYISALLHRAELHIKHNKNYSRAVSDMNRVIKYRPGYDEYYVRRGVALTEAKENERAIKDFNRAIAFNGNYRDDAYFELGKISAAHKKISQARAQFKEALKSNPNHTGAKTELKNIGWY